jgi:hypothetical protein
MNIVAAASVPASPTSAHGATEITAGSPVRVSVPC